MAKRATTANKRSNIVLRRTLPALMAAFAVWALVSSFFALDITEYGLVTRFGRVVRVLAEPGLHVVAPTGEEKIIAGEFTIDEKATPKAMTWTNMKLGRKDADGTQAIYRIEGDDTLKIAGGGKDRPTEFVEKGKDAVRASCEIASQAGTFVAEAVSDSPIRAVKKIEKKIGRQLDQW